MRCGRGNFERLDDVILATRKVGFIILRAVLRQADQDLIVASFAVLLNAGILQANAIQVATNFVEVGRLRELDVSVGAAAKINPERNTVPGNHRNDAGDAEDEREAEEVPLLA